MKYINEKRGCGMQFLTYFNRILSEYSIPPASCISMSDCKIINERKLKACVSEDAGELFVCIFTIPYYADDGKTNISSYAKSRDYHLFFEDLSRDVISRLRQRYPGFFFAGFADNSPIDERMAAAAAGLGIIGKNGLLITEKYSSYIFLGEIITNYPVEDVVRHEAAYCEDCGRCRSACPKEDCGACLSELTQKKGVLTKEEQAIIKKHGSAWGCDLCQECCPHTLRAKEHGTIYTNIDFFKNERIEALTACDIESMSDEEFSARAYAWRKRETVLRNLKILEEENI